MAILLATALLAAGYLLKGPPADPDAAFGTGALAGTFLIFASWAISVYAWGAWCKRVLRIEEPGPYVLEIALGTALASIAAMLLGYFGMIGYAWQPLFVLLMLGGPVLARQVPSARPSGYRPRGALEWLAAGLCGLTLVHHLAMGCLAHGTTDPFIYHLLGPRLWTDRGSITFFPGVPSIFYDSYWEHLFIWGNALLGMEGGRGLVEGQLFGQWTHVLFGFGGSMAAIFAIFRHSTNRTVWVLLAVLAAAQSDAFFYYSWLAKNDFGIALWFLAAWAIVSGPVATGSRELAAAGILLGMALAGKVTTLFTAAPLALAWLVFDARRKGWRRMLPRAASLAGWAAIPMGIIFVRNAWFTGNPVFPLLSYRWPSSWVGPSDPAMKKSVYGGFELNASLAWHRTLALLGDSPLNIVWPALTVLLAARKNDARLRITAWGSLGTVAIFFFWDSPNFFMRWIGPGLLLFAASAVVLVGSASDALIERWGRGRRYALALPPALLLAVYAYHAAPGLKAFVSVARAEPATLAIRDPRIHIGGDSRAWLRMNARPRDLIVTTGDPMLYYVSSLNVAIIDRQPEIDQAVYQAGSIRDVLERLRTRFDARFLLNTDHWEQKYYTRYAAQFDTLAYEHPEAIAYLGVNSFVLDLVKLDEALFPLCRSTTEPNPLDRFGAVAN